MDNYKIKVNEEAESKEAQELFFELGYSWFGCGKHYSSIGNFNYITAYPDEMRLRMGWGGDTQEELTLPQLRDLVVLHRNDVKDATHEAACGTYLFLDSSGDWHFFHKHEAVFYTIDGDISTFVDMPITLIKEQTQQPTEPEQGLISGDDALRALADGKLVEFSLDEGIWENPKDLQIDYFLNDVAEFRLKPRTIKLEIEIPAPFEPKVGEEYFYIQSCRNGYAKSRFNSEHCDQHLAALGAWRTEEEIKQVVAALRGIKG